MTSHTRPTKRMTRFESKPQGLVWDNRFAAL